MFSLCAHFLCGTHRFLLLLLCSFISPQSRTETYIFLSPVWAESLKALCSNLNVLHRSEMESSEGKTWWNCTLSTVTGKWKKSEYFTRNIKGGKRGETLCMKWNSDASTMFVYRVINVPIMLSKRNPLWIYKHLFLVGRNGIGWKN